MIEFHWKNEANRWRSEICLIRSYADNLLKLCFILNCVLKRAYDLKTISNWFVLLSTCFRNLKSFFMNENRCRILQAHNRDILNILLTSSSRSMHRGYYTVARRYEFYVRVARTISHEWAKRTNEILFLPREHKIHIFEPTCNVLFIMWRNHFNRSKSRESWHHWTIRLTEVTCGKYATRVPDEVAYGTYEWFSSQ